MTNETAVDPNLDQMIAKAQTEGKTVLVLGAEEITQGTKRGALVKAIMDQTKRGVTQKEIQHTFDAVWQESMSVDKVDPSEFFISCGPGPIEDRYYGCVMRPATDEEILEGRDEFIVVAIENGQGHTTDFSAKHAAAMRYPTLAVLMGDTYFFPAHTSYDRKRRIMEAAELRRVKRGMTHRPNIHGKKQFWRDQPKPKVDPDTDVSIIAVEGDNVSEK